MGYSTALITNFLFVNASTLNYDMSYIWFT